MTDVEKAGRGPGVDDTHAQKILASALIVSPSGPHKHCQI